MGPRSDFFISFENEELFLNTIKYLSDVLDSKDQYTIGHSERVQRYAMRIGKNMNLSKNQLDLLYLSSILHDIGKVKVPLTILKSKRKLNKYEYIEVQRHSIYGAYLLGSFKYVEGLQEAIKHHHERYDGKGYPDGIRGNEIPIYSRIIAVCDAFDAMTSDRNYIKGMKSENHAFKEIVENRGAQFDPEVADVFVKQYNLGYIFLEKALYFLSIDSSNSSNIVKEFLSSAKRRIKDKRDKKFIDYNMGIVYLKTGLPKKAIPLLKSYIKYTKDDEEKAKVLNDISSAYYYCFDNKKAYKYSKQVLNSRGIFLEKSRSYRHLALNSFQMGYDLKTVFDYMKKSFKINSLMVKKLEQKKKNLLHKNFSIVKFNQLINYKKNLERDLAKYYDIMGFLNYNLGKFNDSIANYAKSIDLKHFYNDLYGAIRSQSGLALVYIEMKRFKDAEYNLIESLRYAEILDDRPGMRIVWNNFGRLYLYWGKIKKSLQYYKKAFNISIELNNCIIAEESALFLINFYKNKKAKDSIRKKYESIMKTKKIGIMNYSILNFDRKDKKELKRYYLKTLEIMKNKNKNLFYVKTFYNFIRFLQNTKDNDYLYYVSRTPSIIESIDDSIVKRKLSRIYTANKKLI